MFIEMLKNAGEHPFVFKTDAGNMEALLTVPDVIATDSLLAIIGHPHSLHGGSMNNKVVTTMARAFREANIPSIRFNFRGVGQSEGVYDDGVGESLDMIALARLWQAEFSEAKFILAGFSFGTFVAWRAAQVILPEQYIAVAPAVTRFDFNDSGLVPQKPLIIQGDADEVVLPQAVYDFAQSFEPPIPVHIFKDAGHFFHGQLLNLKAVILEALSS